MLILSLCVCVAVCVGAQLWVGDRGAACWAWVAGTTVHYHTPIHGRLQVHVRFLQQTRGSVVTPGALKPCSRVGLVHEQALRKTAEAAVSASAAAYREVCDLELQYREVEVRIAVHTSSMWRCVGLTYLM